MNGIQRKVRIRLIPLDRPVLALTQKSTTTGHDLACPILVALRVQQHFACRYCNRLYAPRCLLMLQSTIRSTLPVDITTDYPLYRLSALLSLALLKSTICFDLLDLSILQPIFLCAPFHSVCHHYNRLSALLRDSDGIVSERDRATICSAPTGDTRTDYLLCFSGPSLIVNALRLMPLVEFQGRVNSRSTPTGSNYGFFRFRVLPQNLCWHTPSVHQTTDSPPTGKAPRVSKAFLGPDLRQLS
jgi:hypothetical protein